MTAIPDVAPDLRPAYPPIEPYDRGLLSVGSDHRIYWEACGNPRGKPALFVHGGPGGGCSPLHRRLFDPRRFRIILFDQRGCGRSQPHASLVANTTALLVSDMEALRKALGVDRWLVLGGSWGSTLALLYALAHPARVIALVLRGVFTARQSELHWLYRDGASQLFPEAWQRLIAPIPKRDRGDLVAAYHARLTCGDPVKEAVAARDWCAWEDTIMTLRPEPPSGAVEAAEAAASLARARLETHYFVNSAFLEEGQILAGADRLTGTPGIIVQGRWDAVTPPVTAHELHKVWTTSKLWIIPDAGHATTEPGIRGALVAATDAFAG
jgi:proline iminopeptidase